MSSLKQRLLAVLSAVIVLSAWLEVQHVYEREARPVSHTFSLEATQNPSWVETFISLVDFNALHGELTVRLAFDPQGEIVRNGALTVPMTTYVNASRGNGETVYQKGDLTAVSEVTIGMTDGEAGDYPFDTHRGTIFVVAGTPDKDRAVNGLPMAVHVDSQIPGFAIDVQQVQTSQKRDGRTFVQVTITRSLSVRLFAIFLMGLMLLLAFTAARVVLAYHIDGRLPEVNLFGWLASMLFALVPLRNAMPGAPPVGARCDYQSFFWAEVAIALALLFLVRIFLQRRPRTSLPTAPTPTAPPPAAAPPLPSMVGAPAPLPTTGGAPAPPDPNPPAATV